MNDLKEINVQTLQQKIEDGDQFLLLDVREVHEHEEFNIGGTLIPLGELMGNLENLEKHKSDEVVIYCRSGNRSGMAQQILQSFGFTNVLNLTGGVISWQETFNK